MLLAAGFDTYLPLVDDQSIDGIIRVSDGITTVYHDVQIKGAKSWGGIRCRVSRLAKGSILLLYCHTRRETIWLMRDDVVKHFKPTDSTWGDVFLRKHHIAQFMNEGRNDLDGLMEMLWSNAQLRN
jgi:hypothetical protein